MPNMTKIGLSVYVEVKYCENFWILIRIKRSQCINDKISEQRISSTLPRYF